MQNKEKIIDNSLMPVVMDLCLTFVQKVQDEENQFSEKRLQTLLKRRSYKKLMPFLDRCIRESIYSVAGNNQNSMDDISLKRHILSYENSTRPYKDVA